MKKFNLNGFTLIELMIVVAIIAFLAMIAVPNFMKYVSKAKRSEVYLNLGAIYMAEKAYWAENGTYSSSLKDLGWSPDGETNYTYGFPGVQDVNYKIGKLKAPAFELGIAKADKDSFIAAAVADIDSDGKLDILTINDKREIKIVSDDLA